MNRELSPAPDHALVTHDAPRGGVAGVRAAIEELKAIRTFVAEELKAGLDFGTIPGTGTRPVLLLPGAQKVGMLFNSYPDYQIQATEHGHGHVEYLVTARFVNRGSGQTIGSGIGSCSSMESKYRFRVAERGCPTCGTPAIIKGREEYGGGWLCFKKKGGCGAKFPEGDRRIEGQAAGRVENENIHDVRNTVLKMAMKRGLVSAAMSLGCMSELFTQDLDDVYDITPAASPAPPEPEPAPEPAPEKARSYPKWIRQAAEKLGVTDYQLNNHLVDHFATTAYDGEILVPDPTALATNAAKFAAMGPIFESHRGAIRTAAEGYRKSLQAKARRERDEARAAAAATPGDDPDALSYEPDDGMAPDG